MSRLHEQELKARLTPEPVEPPEELLERLRADIPRDLRMPRLPSPSGPTPRWRPGGTFWKIAAVVVLAAGAGWLAARMGRELPGPGAARDRLGVREALRESPRQVAAEKTARPVDPAPARDRQQREVEDPGEDQGVVEDQAVAEDYVAEDEAPRPSDPGAQEAVRVIGEYSRVPPSPPSRGVRTSAAEAETVSPVEVPVAVSAVRVRALAEDGTALPGAVVELAEGANRRVSLTDRTGAAVFADVPPGKVRVQAHLEGFGSLTRELDKEPGKGARLDLKLPLAALAEELVAAAEPRTGVSESFAVASAYDPSGGPLRRGMLNPPRPEAILGPPARADFLRSEEPDATALGPRANLFVRASHDPLSSFDLAVGTGSYPLVRRWLELGRLPPPEAVRVEEMVNFFDYGDPPPARGDFAVTLEGGPSVYAPWGLEMLRFGLTARAARDGRPETVARDARVQVELNPAAVAEYRLVGYESRAVPDAAFRRDDLRHGSHAGVIGAGHRMSALYELRLHPGVAAETAVARVSVRWFSVEEGRMREIEHWVRRSDLAPSWSETPPSLRLAALVAELGEVLRGPTPRPRQKLSTLAAHARALAAGEYADSPEVAELAELVERAAALERAREKLAPQR